MKPRVILLDIETSPLTCYTWSPWQDNALKILDFSKLMSVGWKELGSTEVTCKTIADYKGYKKGLIDDEKLVKETWDVLDKADVVIAHHGDKFDLPKLNARFVFYGLSAPSAYKSIDTKKVASRYFRFDSNSLNNLGAYLNLGAKVENGGFSLWDKCIQVDKDSWEKMREYNAGDVLLLEQVYLAMRPFMASHPNLNLMTDAPSDGCPACLSSNLQRRGFSFTKTGRKQRFQCTDCGSWSSGPFERVKISSVETEDE